MLTSSHRVLITCSRLALQVAKYVSQLRRVGKGLGVYQFDKELQ